MATVIVRKGDVVLDKHGNSLVVHGVSPVPVSEGVVKVVHSKAVVAVFRPASHSIIWGSDAKDPAQHTIVWGGDAGDSPQLASDGDTIMWGT